MTDIPDGFIAAMMILKLDNERLIERNTKLEISVKRLSTRHVKTKKVSDGLVRRIRELEEDIDIIRYRKSVTYILDPRIKEKYQPRINALDN